METKSSSIIRKPAFRIAIVAVVLIGLYAFFAGTYNRMVQLVFILLLILIFVLVLLVFLLLQLT